jgi:hypothetical protein
MQQQYKRNGNKWSVNEILNLQREYELLEWNVQEIASKHRRSVQAILYKLELENFISSWNDARGIEEWKNSLKNSDDEEEDEEDDEDEISDYNVSEYEEENDDDDDDDESEYKEDNVDTISNNESELDKLTERVWGLETSVEQISSMVKQMFDKMVVNNRSKPRSKLRNY